VQDEPRGTFCEIEAPSGDIQAAAGCLGWIGSAHPTITWFVREYINRPAFPNAI
jgi:hypothetical protein